MTHGEPPWQDVADTAGVITHQAMKEYFSTQLNQMSKRIKTSLDSGKFRTKQSAEKSPDQLPPSFSLQYLSSEFCVSCCEQQEKAHFADTLRKLSQFTWAELKQKNRHKLGFEKISRSSIKVGIPQHVQEDVTFIAFRFDGMKPMVGYRSGHIFYILWLDRNFSVYDH